MAAPIGGQIFSEILPYLEENKTENEKITEEQIETPDVIGKTIAEAKKMLKENDLEVVIENLEEELEEKNIKIIEQTPKAGIVVKKGSKIYLKYQ